MAIEAQLRSQITQFALNHYDVALDEVLSNSHKRHIVHARAMLVWLARTYRPTATYRQISDWLGKSPYHGRALYLTGHRLHSECRHFQRGAEDFAALYRTTMEVPYACA